MQSIDHLLAKRPDTYSAEYRLLLGGLSRSSDVAERLLSGRLVPSALVTMKASDFDTASDKARKEQIQKDDLQQHLKAATSSVIMNPLVSITESKVEDLGLLRGRELSPEVDIDGPPPLEFTSSGTGFYTQPPSLPNPLKTLGNTKSLHAKPELIVIDEDSPMDTGDNIVPAAFTGMKLDSVPLDFLPSNALNNNESLRDVPPPPPNTESMNRKGAKPPTEQARVPKMNPKPPVGLSKEQLEAASKYFPKHAGESGSTRLCEHHYPSRLFKLSPSLYRALCRCPLPLR